MILLKRAANDSLTIGIDQGCQKAGMQECKKAKMPN
jgi:hypothetical protein